jgi:acetyl esterase/lipase
LLTPKDDPKAAFLFFPGGEGYLANPEGRPKALYSRLFPGQGFATVVVDVPSDRPYGMTGTDPFRASGEHLSDVKKIIDFVSERWSKPIFLTGHSAGTTSVAYLGTVLKDSRIGGIVLTGTLGEPVPRRAPRVSPVSLPGLPLHNITYPALFIHHKEDPCANFGAAYLQHSRLIHSPNLHFITVLGGDRNFEIPCSPVEPGRGKSWAHGFSGKEREVATAITDWASGKPVPDRIGP